MPPDRILLNDKLRALAAQTDSGPTFVRPDGSQVKHTFASLVAAARGRLAELQALGLGKGDAVGLILPDNETFVTALLGASLGGIVPVPMYPPLMLGRLEGYVDAAAGILRSARACAVLTAEGLRPTLEPLRERVPTLRAVAALSPADPPGAAGDGPAPEEADLGADDLFMLQFTSGSTSTPKGVVVTHGSLSANAHAMVVGGIEMDSGDCVVSWLPMYHDMGLIGKVLAPLFTETPTVFLPTLSFVKNPRIWMEAVHTHGGTVTFGPNFAFGLAAHRATSAHLERIDLRRLRVVGCGAEPINAGVLRRFAEVYARAGLDPNAIMPCYGMAEATLAITFASLTEPVRGERFERAAYVDGRVARRTEDASAEKSIELVSCGRTFPGHEVAIFSPEGERLPEGAVGEIGYRGPSVTAGYFEDPEATRESYRDGWLMTGDLGFLLDGELYVSGRAKDLIIVNGRNYDPHQVEWAVEAVRGVRKGNVVAFGVQDGRTEKVVAVAESRAAAETHDAMRAAARAAVSDAVGVRLDELVLVRAGTLPKTTSGKVQRRRTRDQYEKGELVEA